MTSLNSEAQKKSSSVLEKLGQKISNIKEDITDNIERRRQSHSSQMSSSSTRTSISEDGKPPTPPDTNRRRISGKRVKIDK